MTATLSDYVFGFIALADPTLAPRYQRLAKALYLLKDHPDLESALKPLDFVVCNGNVHSIRLEQMLFVPGAHINPVALGQEVLRKASAKERALIERMKEEYGNGISTKSIR